MLPVSRLAKLAAPTLAAAIGLTAASLQAQSPTPAAPPVFSVIPGSYSGPQAVSITDSTPGAVIYYTTNGTYPGTYSAVYSTPIAVSQSEILVAVAVATGYANSTFATAEYLIQSSSDRFIYSIAGNQFWGYSGDGGSATQALFNGPYGAVADSQGNVYIADSYNNRVRKVSAATGLVTTIAGTGAASDTGDGGQATSATLWNPQFLALDGLGNLFIGESGDSVVRKLNLNTGLITAWAGSPTGTGTNSGPATNLKLGLIGIACDSSGNLFIGESSLVLAIDPSGNTTELAGSDTTPGIPFASTGGFAIDTNRNIYLAAAGFSKIYKIDPAHNLTLFAGTGFAPGGDGGPATQAGFGFDLGLAVDPAGNLYVADSDYGAVREINVQTGIINTVAGVYGDPYTVGGDGDPATSAGLYFLQFVSVDAAGNIYLADSLNSVRKVTAPDTPPTVAATAPVFNPASTTFATPQPVAIGDSVVGATIYPTFDGSTPLTNGQGYHGTINVTGSATINAIAVAPGYLKSSVSTGAYTVTQPPTAIISTVAGSGRIGFAGVGGPAVSALMASPQSITIRPDGGFYIADQGNHVVWLVAAGTGIISVVAGTGTSGYSGDSGPASSAQLNSPTGLALDSSGNLYIADSGNRRVRMVSAATGTITSFAGPGISTSVGDGGPATSAYLVKPLALAVDSLGNLFIADAVRVREVALSTGIISTYAGGPASGISPLGDGGPATSAYLSPIALALDAGNNLYLVDLAHSRIRVVNALTGIITSVAGGGSIANQDGVSALTANISPTGVAIDSKGRTYFSDGASKVREIQPDGTLVTVAGNGYYGYSGDGGAATIATITRPQQLAFDAGGNLYIPDSGDGVVRKVTFPGPAPAPYFSLAGGTYSTPQSLTLKDSAQGATIYYTYTANGTKPTTASPVYNGPITINTTGIVEAIAVVPGYTQSPIASKAYVYSVLPAAAPPYFNLAGGTYHSPQMLTLTDSTPGAAIHYTTNGTTPTSGSSLYTGPITIAATETVEAVAIAPGYSLSNPSAKAYTYVPYPPATAPVFSLAGGTYNTPQSLTLTDATAGAAIYYTTNGTTPTTASTRYTGSITIASTELVEAVAIATGYNLSPVSSKAYTYSPLPLAAAPYFSLAGGTYATPQMLTLTDSTSGAIIYYTTNGTIPTTASTKYTGPLTVSTTETVIAIASATGYNNSNPSAKAYTIP